MKVLFIGDIVGKSGRNALFEHLPFLREKYQYDLLIINGENSAHGKGITRKIYDSLVEAGADCITMGNHTFSKDNIMTFIDEADRMIRPANMEPENVGKPARIITWKGIRVGIYNVYGTVFMDKATSDPFETMKKLLKEYPSDIRIVDFHGEATSEKYAFMECFKNEVQMIVGTHTHIQTADESIHNGCAFICDVGMTGAYESILGRDTEEVLDHLLNHNNTRYTVSENPGMVCGVIADIDTENKCAVSIERIRILPK
ncbi:MAG: TIGR00282 family metallophosphoesterase [Erysipelotrichaceae bacterium]|nr:TIGR00282 family metallophosphoesterase [Erysipelotrichaceae bacterium]